jgi:glucose/arabinose dehydrogenase
LGSSASANGFDFYKGTLLPNEYQNKAFITRFSKGPITQPDGQYSVSYGDIVLVDPITGKVTQLAEGLNNPLAILADGAGITVADFSGGIYRISGNSATVSEASNILGVLLVVSAGLVYKLRQR